MVGGTDYELERLADDLEVINALHLLRLSVTRGKRARNKLLDRK
jgi:hypothetical protein